MARNTRRAHPADAHASEPTSIRVLELFYSLFEARRGVTRAQLHTIPAYSKMSDDHFRMALGRDLDQLATMGLRWTETVNSDGQSVFCLDSHSVFAPQEVSMTPTQIMLISMALDATTHVDHHLRALLDLTLRATTDQTPADLPPRHGLPRVESDAGLDILAQAIHQRIPVTFPYGSETEVDMRTVEPWRLPIRGNAVYLWGFDLDRQAPRLFRMSRILGDIELIGEPGDCDHEVPDDAQPFESLGISPTLLIRADAPDELLTWVYPVDGDSPPGWGRYQGVELDFYEWRHLIIGAAELCVVVEPADLRDHITSLLERASGRGVDTVEAPHA